MMELARMYGWEPAGTEVPAIRDEDGEYVYDPLDWNGSYETSEYQNVTAEDASSFGAALDYALMDVPGEPTAKHDAPGSFSGVRGVDLTKKKSPVEFFSGPIGRGHVEKVIRLCQTGAFQIG
jgi:hypothetical protein